MKKIIKPFYLLLLLTTSAVMSQTVENLPENVISHGYVISTGSLLHENTLILNKPLAGIGGSTWAFEIFNNELVILTFFWGVRPDANPELDNQYIISASGEIGFIEDIKVEYKTYRTSDEKLQIQLLGQINSDIKIDVKKDYPFDTDIKTAEFIELLNKYNIKIEQQILE